MNIILVLEICVFGILTVVGGVGNSMLNDLMNKTTVLDASGAKVRFRKPWLQTLLAFVAFAFAFIPLWIRLLWLSLKKNKPDETAKVSKKGVIQIGALALCNCLSRITGNISLFWLPVSIWQALRGSNLIFTVLLTVFYRKRKLRKHEMMGVGVVFTALVLISMQALLQKRGTSKHCTSTTWQILLGIVFVLGSQGINAMKVILMEKYLSDLKMHSFSVIAWQGFWGILVCSLVILPVCSYLPGGVEGDGFHEHTLASFHEILKSPRLMHCTVGLIVSLFCCSVFGAYLIKVTSALTRTILEQFRGFVVWAISLVLHIVSHGSYGESWSKWSLVQLGGLFLITLGSIIYSGAFATTPTVLITEKEKNKEEGGKKKRRRRKKVNLKKMEKAEKKEVGGGGIDVDERNVETPLLQLHVSGQAGDQDSKEELKSA